MLRPFQVNIGRFLSLDREVQPTAKVSELCEAIEYLSGEDANSQVLLASDGRQMTPSELIGAYSIGTESKPIFVFYRSHLVSPDPPATPTILPNRGDLQHQLEILRHKPTPAGFQKQVSLAKRLSEHSAQVGRVCGQLAEEYQLQCSGWKTVLSNCNSIIRTYQKHQVLFTKSLEGFHDARPHFLKLLQEFPAQVKLLQQLPVPAALQSEDTPTSLYDWISTHDEKNSLRDLGAQCQRSLAKVDGDRIDSTLQSSQQILTTAELLFAQEDQFGEVITHLRSLAEDSVGTVDTQMKLAQNIQSTSLRALRSGDAGTIADLVMSHHKSLQLMAEYCRQLESSVREIEETKLNLTRHIHTKLKQVTQLQKRVADSNSQLVMFHEHVKLAKKRFEILEQVCTTPQVLASVLSEVERRRMYSSSLEKKTDEVSVLLRRAREEEKLLRKKFFNTCGQHFVLTLFPELQERVPDITVHFPKSLAKSTASSSKDLESIRNLLPDDIRTSSTELVCSSVRLLSTPASATLTETQTTEFSSQSSDLSEPALTDSLPMRSSATEAACQTEDNSHLEKMLELERQNLKKSTLQLESLTQEMLLDKERHVSEEEKFEQFMSQARAENEELQIQVDQLQKEKEELRQQLEEHCVRQESVEHSHSEGKRERELLQLKLEETMTICENLTSELRDCKLANAEQSSLLQQHVDAISEKESQYECEVHERQSLEELCNQLKMINEELATKRDGLQLELSQTMAKVTRSADECTHLKIETSRLEEEVQRITKEFEQSQTEKGVLIRQANQVQDIANVTRKLQEKEAESMRLSQQLNQVNSQLKIATDNLQLGETKSTKQTQEYTTLQTEFQNVKEKYEAEKNLQDSRYQQAQSAIGRLKSQLEKARTQVQNAESRAAENLEKLHKIEGNVAAKNNSVSLEERLELSEKHKVEAEKLVEQRGEKIKELEKLCTEIKRERDDFLVKSEETEKKLQSLEVKLEAMSKDNEKRLRESSDRQTKYLEEIKELKIKCAEAKAQRDGHMKHGMEIERELKELKRDLGQSSPTIVESGSPLKAQKTFTISSTSSSSASSKGGILLTASIGSLQIGDHALFISDQYGNYLALTMDEKTYYLNQTSIGLLEDIAVKNPRLSLRRKILFGKLTNKVLVEVRKESNRLHVPVGERLYKVDAEPCSM